MIRATELSGRAVVDMDAAEKLGRVDRITIDPDARKVAAFQVTRGGPLHAGETQVVSASSVHAIGPDAITVRREAMDGAEAARIAGLPCVSDVIGRKVVSQQGRLLGVVDDVIISGADGRIVGYQLGESNVGAKIESLFRDRKDRRAPYLRADANLRAGRDLIVAPEDAVCTDWEAGDAAPHDEPQEWARRERAAAGRPFDRTDRPLDGIDRPLDPIE